MLILHHEGLLQVLGEQGQTFLLEPETLRG